MPARVWLIIGIAGLNICLLNGQEPLLEQHLAKGRKLRAQALYKEAETEYLAAVQAALVLGPENPKLARCWNNLGALYQDQGRYTEAEALYRQAAAVWERAPGFEEDLAACLNNLAVAERAQGRHKEAESVFLRAIGIMEKSLPPDHPSLPSSWNNLGELYLGTGRFQEAEPLLRRALWRALCWWSALILRGSGNP